MTTDTMNIATEEGFRAAWEWTRKQMASIKEHDAMWVIARSHCCIRVLSHAKLEAEVMGMEREPAVIGMLRAQGWQLKGMRV